MSARNGPDDGTIIIEPVENGWLVVHWSQPERNDDELDDDELEDAPLDDDGYDPSAMFAQQHDGPQRHVIAHLHMSAPQREPRRYVFSTTESMLAHVAKLAKTTEDQKVEESMKKEAKEAMRRAQ